MLRAHAPGAALERPLLSFTQQVQTLLGAEDGPTDKARWTMPCAAYTQARWALGASFFLLGRQEVWHGLRAGGVQEL